MTMTRRSDPPLPRQPVSRWMALTAGLAVGGLSAPALAKPHLEPTVGAEVTVTDNIDLMPNGQRQSAVVFSEFAGLTLREAGRRLRYALDGRLYLDTTVGHGTDVALRPDVTGTGRIELVEGHLYVEGRLLSQRELINAQGRVGSSSVIGRSNQANVTTLELSPYLTGHIGPYADTELRYLHRDTLVDTRDGDGAGAGENRVGNAMTNALSWQVTSGRALSRLRLTSNIEYSNTRAEVDENDLERQTAIVSADYAVTRQVFLLGSAGWERIASPGLSDTRRGMIGSVGLRYRPSPRLDLALSAGHRYGGPTYEGTLTYAITSRWSATASYSESMETPQTRLGRPVGRIALDPQTGALVIADARDLGIQRAVAKVGTLRFDMVGHYQVDDVYLSVTRETRDYDTGPDDQLLTAGARWHHRLSPRLTLIAQAQLRQAASDTADGDTSTLTGGVNLTYALSDTLTGSVSLSRSQRFSSRSEDRYTENAIVFGLTARF